MMRLHVLGIPSIPSRKEFLANPFTQKIVNFTKMMHRLRGHRVYHYGVESSDLVCTEHVPVVSDALWTELYGMRNWKDNYFIENEKDLLHLEFQKNTIAALEERVEPNDFLICLTGNRAKFIAEQFPTLIPVEAGIGYSRKPWARFKIFESYSILHSHYGVAGLERIADSLESAVIPNFIDLDDFPNVGLSPDPYYLFIGRIIKSKGLDIAIETTRLLNQRLVIAGVFKPEEQGFTLPRHVEFVGYADVHKRQELYTKALATFVPTLYHEPFGNVAVESLICGTPVIATDRGAFTETIQDNVNGFRCNWLSDFIDAARRVQFLDRKTIARDARRIYGLDEVAPRIERYLRQVEKVRTVPFQTQRSMPTDYYALHRDQLQLL